MGGNVFFIQHLLYTYLGVQRHLRAIGRKLARTKWVSRAPGTRVIERSRFQSLGRHESKNRIQSSFLGTWALETEEAVTQGLSWNLSGHH